MLAMWKLLPPDPTPRLEPTAAQAEAARAEPGVTVVLGGPGSGKTSTLVAAVVDRLADGGSLADYAVLAGSRAAAQAIRRDVVAALPKAQASPTVTTVHGLALGLLRQFQPVDEEPWALLRAPQQEQRIRDLLANPRVEWPEEMRPALGTRAFSRQLREVLARVRQRSWDEAYLAELAAQRGDATLAAVADFLDEYLAVGDLEHTLDYAELVYRVRLLLREDDVVHAVRDRFREVFVDDAHDLDPAQAGFLKDLAGIGLPLTAFGDPQQVVSGFRGASGDGLVRLLDLTPSRLVALDSTHRHGGEVAAALRSLRERIDATNAPPLQTSVREEAGEVTVRIYDDPSSEAAHVADQLRRAVADGARWSDCAVIMRAGRAQLAPMTRELLRLGIPVEVAADELVLAEEESVVTLLLALKVAAGGGRPDADQARLLLSSKLCGVDAIALRRLGRALLAEHAHLGHSEQLLGRCLAEPELLDGIDTPEAEAARGLATMLRTAATHLADGKEVQLVLWDLWSATQWPEQLRQAALTGSRRANHQLDAVVELFERAARHPVRAGAGGAMTFITELAGEEIPADTGREMRAEGQGVQLTTAHRAKGLQWRRVWVVGVQEGRWPRLTPGALLLDPGRLLDGTPRTIGEQLREERRLFYLACSRASTHLHVSGVRGAEGEASEASRFVHELGVDAEQVPGRPRRPLTGPALVGALRGAAADPEASETLRRGAARRLARLARAGIQSARPEHWWTLQSRSAPAPGEDGEVWLSGSVLEDLLGCPRRYFLERRARAARARQSRASVGDVVHLIAKHAQLDGLSLPEMRRELATVWERIPFEAEWLSASERVEIDAGLERLARWIDEHRDNLLGVEEPFQVRIRVGDTDVVLHGTADRVEQLHTPDGPRLRVVDFKTGRRKRSPAEVAGDIQLGLYQLAAAEGAFEHLAPGIRDVEAPALLFLRHDATGLPLVVEQSSIQAVPALNDEELVVGPTWVHDRIATAVETLRSGQFPATENPACGYCQFKAGCPVFSKEVSR